MEDFVFTFIFSNMFVFTVYYLKFTNIKVTDFLKEPPSNEYEFIAFLLVILSSVLMMATIAVALFYLGWMVLGSTPLLFLFALPYVDGIRKKWNKLMTLIKEEE